MNALTASKADKHWLYENSVQNPEAEVSFIDRVFRSEFKRRPSFLREDFCGTANLSSCWVSHRKGNTALGIDNHLPTLDWGRRHNLAPLGDNAASVELVHADVRSVTAPKADVLAATNFSWWGFHTRPELLEYFSVCHESLKDEGMLMLDIYGGPEAQVLQFEERECEGFTYVWDQDVFNPITHEYRCRIHFQFPDGSEMKNAFRYHWRLWSIPEACEILAEAGFRKSGVYWEGSDKKGNPNGIFRHSVRGDQSPAWIAYIVAFR